MAVKYVRPSGADANDGTSWTDVGGGVGPWKSLLTRSGGSLSAGDEIRYEKTPDPYSIGTCTWPLRSTAGGTVTFPSGLIKVVDQCEATWDYVATGVSQATSASRKVGSTALSFTVTDAASSGKLAYKTLTSTDFSGFAALTFWISSTVSQDLSSGLFRLALCTDTAGETIDRYVDIPFVEGNGNYWHAFAVDAGGAFSSAIQSIALYATSDPGATTLSLKFDNICACKASTADDALSHTVVFGQNTAAEPLWYGVRGFDSDTTMLATRTMMDSESTTNYMQAEPGDCTTYIRKTQSIGPAGAQTTALEANTMPDDVLISGGWSDGSTRDGMTFYQIVGPGSIIATSPDNFYMAYFGCLGGFVFLYSSSGNMNGLYAEDCWFAGQSYYSLYTNTDSSANVLYNCGVTGQLLVTNGTMNDCWTWNTGDNLALRTDGCHFWMCSSSVGALRDVAGTLHSNVEIRGPTCDIFRHVGNYEGSTPLAPMILRGYTITYGSTVASGSYNSPGELWIENYGGTPGDHRLLKNPYDSWNSTNPILQSESSVRHTPSGLAWKFNLYSQAQLTMSVRTWHSACSHRVASLAVKANLQVTVKLWVRRSNTAAYIGIVAPKGYLTGISSDVTDEITAAADTWEELQIQFTPTQSGIQDIFVYSYNTTINTYYTYFDDMTISQATS